MAGRRFLDLAAVFNASKSIADKHIAMRLRTIESFSKTSAIVKGVQSQTARIPLACQAAYDLAQRLKEPNLASKPTDFGPTSESSSATFSTSTNNEATS